MRRRSSWPSKATNSIGSWPARSPRATKGSSSGRCARARWPNMSGQEKIRGQLAIFIEAAKQRKESLDHVLLFGPPGPRQDDALAHHRARARRQPAPDLGARARARRRPGGAAHEPGVARRPVHRRDPSSLPRGRGDPLPCARGLPDRHHDRRGPGRAQRQARPAAVHAGRRHHAGRDAHQPAARPLRHRRAPRVLHAGGADADRHAVGCAPQDRDRPRRRARDRAALARHAADRQPALAARPRLRSGTGIGRHHADASPPTRSRCSTSTWPAST